MFSGQKKIKLDADLYEKARALAEEKGYASVEDYYEGSSSGPHLSGIRVPTLLLSSANDPLIPVKSFEAYHRINPDLLRFVHPARGGHLGYWQKGRPRFRAATLALSFLEEKIGALRNTRTGS